MPENSISAPLAALRQSIQVLALELALRDLSERQT